MYLIQLKLKKRGNKDSDYLDWVRNKRLGDEMEGLEQDGRIFEDGFEQDGRIFKDGSRREPTGLFLVGDC